MRKREREREREASRFLSSSAQDSRIMTGLKPYSVALSQVKQSLLPASLYLFLSIFHPSLFSLITHIQNYQKK